MLTRIREVDLGLLLAVLVLVSIGIEMVYSASFVVGYNEFGDGAYFLVRHVAWIVLGLGALIVTTATDYHWWRRLALPLLIASLCLLTVVLLLGATTYGSARWLGFGLLAFQPSELTKLSLTLYLASWLARVGDDIRDFNLGTVPFLLVLCLAAGLVILEPDLGTAVILILTACSIFFVAGANVLHALAGTLIGAGVMALLTAVARLWGGSGYGSQRLLAFVDPWKYAEGIGWQTTQILLALGSGGLTGLGLGAGRQKFYYVPNAHTDGIFAIVGEEIGFIGTTLVLLLFLVIAWRGFTIALSAPDSLGRFLATGLTALLVWQGLLNMAVVTSTVPYTGIPLPFISYGGSAMVTSLTAAGMLLSISRRKSRALSRSRSWNE